MAPIQLKPRTQAGTNRYNTRIQPSFFSFPLPPFFAGTSGLGSVSSIQAAVRQLEAEADAIIQMVREGQRARRQQQATTVSMVPVALAGQSFCLFELPFFILFMFLSPSFVSLHSSFYAYLVIRGVSWFRDLALAPYSYWV